MALSDTAEVGARTAIGSDRRLARAKQVLALLRRALPARSQLEFALAADAPHERGTAARIVFSGPDALGHILWPPSADALGEAYLRGDLDIEGDIWAVIDAGRSFDLRRLGRDLPGFEDGSLDVAQLLLPRPTDDGAAQRPLRPWWNE